MLGLIGRNIILDMLEAVDAEDAPAAFALVERAIERGYDLRILCRELARATRDLLILSVDPGGQRIPSLPRKATATGCRRSPAARRARICCAPSTS